MFFKKKSNVIFRNYNSFGYITDNRNFGYLPDGYNEKFIGDKILSESGSVFYSVLSKTPQELNDLAKKIKDKYQDVDIITIKDDAKEFYNILEQDGFVISGNSIEECNSRESRFSYKKVLPKYQMSNFLSLTDTNKKSTQIFFDEFFDGKPQLTNLHIEINSICNERCIHCYIPHDYKVSFIDPDLFYNILKQCKDLNLLHLTISGGEPLMHKEFCNFLKKCNEYNFSINVLSNLTLLNDEIISEMKNNPLLGVQVSLYSMIPEIHDEITQLKGSFEKTKKSILKLIDNDIPLQISCPIMKQNKESFSEVVEWGNKHHVQVGDDYVIIAKYNHTTQNLKCRLSINEIKELINKKISHSPKYLEHMELDAHKKSKVTLSDFVCSVCHSSICISDNGNVYPCPGWQDYILGNVKELCIKEIWDHSEKVQFLRNLRNLDFKKCIQCSDKMFCTMCMVRNANENSHGDPLVVNDFFCDIARLNKQIFFDYKIIEDTRSN